jgi:hypothetical protein
MLSSGIIEKDNIEKWKTVQRKEEARFMYSSANLVGYGGLFAYRVYL